MKLYVFDTFGYGCKEPEFVMQELEVEEKDKIYVTGENCIGRRRKISKSIIGRASGPSLHRCILLENNPSQAAEILMKVKENELQYMEITLQTKKKEIENLRQYIQPKDLEQNIEPENEK